MKIKEGLSLNAMGDNFVVVADDAEVFGGMIKLNKSGAFVFEMLLENKSAEETIKAIVDRYEVDRECAEKDFYEFMKAFEAAELIEND